MLTKEVPFKGMEGFQVAWMVVEKKQRPPIPDSAPEAIRQLIQSCWDHDPRKRMDVGAVLKILDRLSEDGTLHRDADKFMIDKEDWEDEYEDLMDSLRTEQHSSVQGSKSFAFCGFFCEMLYNPHAVNVLQILIES